MPVTAVHDHISILLKKLAAKAVPGEPLQTFLIIVDEYLQQNNLISINRGYDDGRHIPFPFPLCIDINNCIAHGIPSPKYRLLENDIIGFDLGIRDEKTRDCADAALTVGVGKIEKYNEKLLRAAKEALYRGIDEVKPGVPVFVVGDAIEAYAQTRGYVVNKIFLGHAIGKEMHEKPHIPHVRAILEKGVAIPESYKFQIGQKICLEPALTAYDKLGVGGNDGWSTFTKDNRNSAMFEHMIEVTKDGHKVLTTHVERD